MGVAVDIGSRERKAKMTVKTIEMPDVRRCQVETCAFNVEDGCRARAITVGAGMVPACDTFFDSTGPSMSASRVAGVGACKNAECKFNTELECQAEAIMVATGGSLPACQTFAN